MDRLFLTALNMSLTGTFIIAVICLVRLPLKKAPKIISYCMWAIAGFRLVFPFTIKGVFSLIPFKAQTIPMDIATQAIPRISSGVTVMDNIISESLPAPVVESSVNTLQIWTAIGAYVWLLGIAAMFIYGIASFALLKQKMKKAVRVDSNLFGIGKPYEANIYEANNIQTPFVLGLIKPKIYIPVGLSAKEREYIIIHEQTHIRRLDHVIKFIAYFILCMHWFNPMVAVAFLLMGSDMEMSCDECVLMEMGSDIKRDYSLSLLSLATRRRTVSGSPLAFGEGSVKARVRNVLNFKKRSRITNIASVVLVIVLSVGFMTNTATASIKLANKASESAGNQTTHMPGGDLTGNDKVNKDTADKAQEHVPKLPKSEPTNPSSVQEEGDEFLDGAWLSYQFSGGSNITLKFPDWYTEDMWDVEFIWGDYAVIPIQYGLLDTENSVMVGIGEDTHYELKVGFPDKEAILIDLRELARRLISSREDNNGTGYFGNSGYYNYGDNTNSGGDSYTTAKLSQSEADKRGLAIMTSSGTWSSELDMLIPYMTSGGVEKVVTIYLDRHLFPGITTSEGAEIVETTIDTALKYMSSDAKKTAESRISAYY